MVASNHVSLWPIQIDDSNTWIYLPRDAQILTELTSQISQAFRAQARYPAGPPLHHTLTITQRAIQSASVQTQHSYVREAVPQSPKESTSQEHTWNGSFNVEKGRA
jgi:hypothetical protein